MGMFAADLLSWIESANEPCGFSLNHLPLGAFEHKGATRLCVAIGEEAADLHTLHGEFTGALREALQQSTLNPLLELGPGAWRTLRADLTRMLHQTATEATKERVRHALVPRRELALTLPMRTRGYMDFYASLEHARRVGEIFRPDNPLLPNYRHVPIAYNGRASSLVVSGTPVRRPWGQLGPAADASLPGFAPTRALDYEAELACIVGYGNLQGETIGVRHAASHLFGVALLNDWSARDIQAWEYQPLGPFLGKSFATTVSPWITPLMALEPFRVPARGRAEGEPQPLPYLLDEADQQSGGLDLRVECWIRTHGSTAAQKLSSTSTAFLFWTPAQMVAHATSNGCPLESGDILATGTISGPARTEGGCLLELTRNGAEPIQLANREQRRWLAEGDEVILRGFCERDGLPPVHLGECRGRILPALESVIAR